MSSPAASISAQEINQLHEQVVQQTENSKKCLHSALEAAWQAGRLLLAEQKRVRRTMGAAWGFWLDEQFSGSRRTAQNYMRLAETAADLSEFEGLSLRQVYLRLGIATEPKSRLDSPRVESLPTYIRLANRLIVALRHCERKNATRPEQRAALQQDLRALYERLHHFFEPLSSENFPPSNLSDN
jgi:hypothetical protein